MKSYSNKNKSIKTCKNKITILEKFMTMFRITAEKKTEVISWVHERNINFVEVVVIIILINDVTIEEKSELTGTEVCEKRLWRLVRPNWYFSVRKVECSHSTIAKDNTISICDIDDVEISIFTVENSIEFSVIVDISELAIDDDIYLFRLVDNLRINYVKISAWCLWLGYYEEKEEKSYLDSHLLVFVL